jgi:hypothetical protein
MTIRIELRMTAVCEECRYEWTPTQYYSDALKMVSLECPQCAIERDKARRLIQYFDDPVIDLIN